MSLDDFNGAMDALNPRGRSAGAIRESWKAKDKLRAKNAIYGQFGAYSPVTVSNEPQKEYSYASIGTLNSFLASPFGHGRLKTYYADFLMEELVGHQINAVDEYIKGAGDFRRDESLRALAKKLGISVSDFKNSIVGGPKSTGTEMSCRHWNALLNDIDNVTGEPIQPLVDRTTNLDKLDKDWWLNQERGMDDPALVESALKDLFK